ncbi:YebG family protein [Oceanisphaera avium]|uniref:Damage-inducible protein YebG n=1 Tax=Oceanisphaera avium TaxID=1903694 RepID=A0A1Y0CWW5_9GAMM|nr:YebG family protein [Oceanisphaera avium]ART79345.1 damage-inducible protein YebG [Oceanisphaera avium]
MAVTIQYLVVRNGIEKMTFTNKKEADAFDKLLDLAEHLDQVLSQAPVQLAESDREALALFLAQHQDQLSGPKKVAAKKSSKPAVKEGAITEVADDAGTASSETIHAVA